jgi:hypothetical protein
MPVNTNQHWIGRHFVADLSAIVWLLLAIGLWLVPLFKTGAKFGPVKWLPRHVTYLHGCAGLFTMREASWGQVIYLVKRENASAWVEMDRDWVSPMPVAGYRQRLDRVFGEVRRKRIYPQIYSGMAAYVARRAGELAPELPKVTEVRFINTRWSTKDAYLNDPSGRWRLLPWQELGTRQRSNTWRWAIPTRCLCWNPGWCLCSRCCCLGSGFAVIIHWHRRPALWLLLVCAFYAQAVDYYGSFAYNKIFIAVYALLATGPGPYRDESGRLVVSAAMPRMIQATVVTIYFAAGVAKAFHGDWLKHSDVLWTQVQGFHRNELSALLLHTLPKWAWTGMQHSALAFELGAPLLFLVPRLRWIGIAYGIAFHFMIAALMYGLIYFSVQMWSFYAIWIGAEQWRWLGVKLDEAWDRLRGRDRSRT